MEESKGLQTINKGELSDVALSLNENTIKLIEGFQKHLQVDPPKNELQINKFAKNSQYLPISFVQMKLDEMFYGLWSTKNFSYSVVANEILGVIELEFFHPVAKMMITRTGTASVMIQMKSEENGGRGDITYVADKITNTLVKDFPHLLSECTKCAAKTIAKMFGRDLNREFIDSYQPQSNIYEAMAEIDLDKELLKSLLEERDVNPTFKESVINTIEQMSMEKIKGAIIYLQSLSRKSA
jgi:hypothetical protein